VFTTVALADGHVVAGGGGNAHGHGGAGAHPSSIIATATRITPR
jgi:hypothetical protein